MESILDDKYFEWKIVLNFISIFDTLEEVVFNEYSDFVGFVLAEAEPNKVYLISAGSRVYVTQNIMEGIYFTEMVFNKILPDPFKFTELEQYDEFDLDSFEFNINCFVQEYHTFEEAYAVALTMMEEWPNCYNK